MIPASPTGLTVAAYSMLPKYNARQLVLFKAVKLGEVDKTVVAEMLAFAAGIKSLPRPDKAYVQRQLAVICA